MFYDDTHQWFAIDTYGALIGEYEEAYYIWWLQSCFG
jgi:hypothetical protein